MESSYRDRRQHPSLRQTPGCPWGDHLCAVTVGGLEPQLDNQLGRLWPSPTATRQFHWPLGQPSARPLRWGRRNGNNHLYRQNILLQKVPELSLWSKSLMENKL